MVLLLQHATFRMSLFLFDFNALFDRLKDNRCLRLANWVKGNALCLDPTTFMVPFDVEQAVLSLEKAAWSLRMLPSDVVVSGSTNQATKFLSRLHAGLRLLVRM